VPKDILDFQKAWEYREGQVLGGSESLIVEHTSAKKRSKNEL
jgi:hypothetical protein